MSFEKNYDVAIIGGGLAGAVAAIAASRCGAKATLIEQSGVLGGQATLGIVTPLSATGSVSGESFGGICEEIFTEILETSKNYAAPPDAPCNYENINPHITKYVLLKKCIEAGVDVMFHTTLTGAVTADNNITEIEVFTKSGYGKIRAKSFVDTTGDGDLICLSDAGYFIGSEGNVYEELAEENLAHVLFEGEDKVIKADEKALQPVSAFFKLRGVDVEKAISYNNKSFRYEDLGIDREEFRQEDFYNTCGFEENGDLIPLPQGRILVLRGMAPDEAVINMSRVTGINGTDADSLNRGECLAQLQVMNLVRFLKKYVEGFENSYLTESASTLGVRETRRLRGKYVLKGTDAIRCVRFDDAVARGSYIIDIHDPMGKNKSIGGAIKGDFYDIPLRSLMSEKYDNLFAAGRCISADHVAHSSTRVQGTCMLTGQAAGTAAAQYCKDGVVDYVKVRQTLISAGMNI